MRSATLSSDGFWVLVPPAGYRKVSTAPMCQSVPPSSEYISAAWLAIGCPAPSLVSALTPNTSRPACVPYRSWMPWLGPLAYQESQSGRLICALMSRGVDQLRPSSSEYCRCGVRGQGVAQPCESLRPRL
ncbi:hypothetical protein GCM10009635_24140 [Actinocatenispora thailandica]